jgi:hypothetical protein
MNRHLGIKLFKCPKCPKKYFDEKRSLRVHMANRHEAEKKNHECNHCDRRFLLKSQLRKHMEVISLNEFEKSESK